MKQEILVKVEHMNKRFGSTVALKDVSIEVCSGRVLGLIGENGSGKSTVTSIIAGMQNADSGTLTYHDKEWKPESMLYSLEHGIGMIVQETGTVPGITVAENIFLGETKFFKSFGEKHKWGPVKRKLLNQKAQEALDAIGASHIRAEQMTASLDLQERKLIEIARIMNKHPEVLVVDETTTALSQKGREINSSLDYKETVVQAVMEYINSDCQNANLTKIAEDTHQSMTVLSKLIKQKTGYKFQELLQRRRFQKAVYLLMETELTVEDIALEVGYENQSYFYRQFQKRYGMTPAKYRKLHKKDKRIPI